MAQKYKFAQGEMDQVDNVLWQLKNTPYSRRIMTNLYNYADLSEMGLEPCAYSMTFNVTREQGQPNPEFDFESFEGLLDFEQSPVWAEQPVITTTANENSPVGEYPIVVESGMAESYNMTFVEGTLTVTTPTGIDAPTEAEKHGATHPQQIHDLSGRQLHGATTNTLKPGLYIVNGRKMMMK
jgi:hypothetical protein